jgi:hypothetical protein
MHGVLEEALVFHWHIMQGSTLGLMEIHVAKKQMQKDLHHDGLAKLPPGLG